VTLADLSSEGIGGPQDQIPSTNPPGADQIANKSQMAIAKFQKALLKFDAWDLFGIWRLDFGN
jgi:hypothetical protein